MAVPSWHGQKSTKTHFPKACAAIRAGRYRVEFYQEPEERRNSFGLHPRFLVLLDGREVFECSGAARALSYVEQEESARLARLADRASGAATAVPSSHAGRTGRGARAPRRARATATS